MIIVDMKLGHEAINKLLVALVYGYMTPDFRKEVIASLDEDTGRQVDEFIDYIMPSWISMMIKMPNAIKAIVSGSKVDAKLIMQGVSELQKPKTVN